ncbi:MAG: stage III sporulation protein AE [Solirubrobacterales bacterium]
MWTYRVLTVLVMCLTLTFGFGLAIAEAAPAEPPPETASWQAASKKLDLSHFEEYKNKIDGEFSPTGSSRSVAQWLGEFAAGKWELNPAEIGAALKQYFIGEVAASIRLLGKILVLAVISALLINLQSSFENKGVAGLASMACFLALSAIALGSFKHVLLMGRETIGGLADFMTGILPQMMILVTGIGHVHTAAGMFPLLMVMSTTLANTMNYVVFPLIVISAVLSLIDCLGDTVKIERLAKLVTMLAEVTLGIVCTVFVTILTARSVYGSVMDALTLKTGKFVTDTFFPVVGGYLADALETTAGYVVLLKQAVGILGVLIVFGILIFPVIKIAVVALVYKLAGALVEPLGDARTSKALDLMGNHLIMVLAAVTIVGLMFLILLAIVAMIGNATVLSR